MKPPWPLRLGIHFSAEQRAIRSFLKEGGMLLWLVLLLKACGTAQTRHLGAPNEPLTCVSAVNQGPGDVRGLGVKTCSKHMGNHS